MMMTLCEIRTEGCIYAVRPGQEKTTITNLINRFYDIADGKIRYDGININKIKNRIYVVSLGMVLQGIRIFTVRWNKYLHYGNLEASDERVSQRQLN